MKYSVESRDIMLRNRKTSTPLLLELFMTEFPLSEQLTTILRDHVAVLELFASQWTTSAEDVVQEALIEFVRQSQRPSRPIPWLYRVVRNLAIRDYRKRTTRTRHEEEAGLQRYRLIGSAELQISAEDLMQAMEALESEKREVIVARIWGGLTLEEIGEVVGCSASTAYRRYEEGLVQLRERLAVSWTNQKTPK